LLVAEKSLGTDPRWRVVYRLSTELESDPQHMKLVQALTLDASRPSMGLKGTHGLFGSPEWWNAINTGVIPLTLQSGVICGLSSAGMDSHGELNTCALRTDDGATIHQGIYVNAPGDHSRYKVGFAVAYLSAMDEWKTPSKPPDMAGILLEVALSRTPAE
jgi:hypothetical protein